jgi:AAA+ superfamily predicted ATPase
MANIIKRANFLIIFFNYYITANSFAYFDNYANELQHIIKIFEQNNQNYTNNSYDLNEYIIPAFVLLHGPSGVGKSTMARSLAHNLNAKLIEISGPSVVKRYIGDGALSIKNAFADAATMSKQGLRVVIFIDEIDAFAGRNNFSDEQNSEWGATTQELQHQLDVCDKNNIFFVATTNYIQRIDDPLLMRMSCVLKINLPNDHERLNIIKFLLDILKINLTEAEIFTLVSKSNYLAFRDIKQAIILGSMSENKKIADFVDSFKYIYKIRFKNITVWERLKKINKEFEPVIQICTNLQTGYKIAASLLGAAIIIYKYSKNLLNTNLIN